MWNWTVLIQTGWEWVEGAAFHKGGLDLWLLHFRAVLMRCKTQGHLCFLKKYILSRILCPHVHWTSSHVTHILQPCKALKQPLAWQTVLISQSPQPQTNRYLHKSIKELENVTFPCSKMFPTDSSVTIFSCLHVVWRRQTEKESDRDRQRMRTEAPCQNSCKVLYFSWVITGECQAVTLHAHSLDYTRQTTLYL